MRTTEKCRIIDTVLFSRNCVPRLHCSSSLDTLLIFNPEAMNFFPAISHWMVKLNLFKCLVPIIEISLANTVWFTTVKVGKSFFLNSKLEQ